MIIDKKEKKSLLELECYGCNNKFDILNAKVSKEKFYCPHCDCRLIIGVKLVVLKDNETK